jgi:hypothetical protein
MKSIRISTIVFLFTFAFGGLTAFAQEQEPTLSETGEELPEPVITEEKTGEASQSEATENGDSLQRPVPGEQPEPGNRQVSSPRNRFPLGYIPNPEIKRSPRDYFLTIKFGSYKPEHLRAIWDNDTPDDDSDDVAVDYTEIYPDREQFIGLLDAAWTPITKYTTLGIGGGFGVSYAEGKALRVGYGGFEETENRVTFVLVPMHLSLFWNLQFWEKQPVIPGFSVGYDAWFWNEDKAEGDGKGNGFRQGWHAAASLWFLLDWLEPTHATRLDNDYGINHTYLVAEYRYSAINGFGNRGFDFTDHTFSGGLGFAF